MCIVRNGSYVSIRGCAPIVTLIAGMGVTACTGPEGGPFVDSITEAQLRADVYALAHDSTCGRLVGTPEHDRVGEWIRDRFNASGLEPAGDDGTYFQSFNLLWFSLGAGNRLSITGSNSARDPGDGWYPLNFSATASATGDVVFVGFGIQEPRVSYDDYRGNDVRGKIVLVLEQEPGIDDPESQFDGLVTSEASRAIGKALAAQANGAAAILFVRDIHNRPDITDWEDAAASYWPTTRRRIEQFSLEDWVDRIKIPCGAISSELAEALLAPSGMTLAALAEEAEAAANGFGVRVLPGARIAIETSVDRHTTFARNVLATISGADQELQREVVIILAHYDHNGADGDSVFNGADDNASGTAGMLAIAAAYARAADQGRRPRRSILFMASDSEERGPLLGSWYYTLHPAFPLANTVAVFNIDQIGRNEEVPQDGGSRFRGLEPQTAESNANAVNILGSSRSPALASVVSAANDLTGLTLRYRYDNNESNLLRRNDQWPFIQNDVPALFIFTGLHPDYHRVTDQADRLNYGKMTRIVQLVYHASWNAANSVERPEMKEMGAKPWL